MKKNAFLNSPLPWVFFLSVALTGWTLANSISANVKPFNPRFYLGTKTPYKDEKVAQTLGALSRCEPIHINHLGRHGSRHLGKPFSQEAAQIIKKAQMSGQLLPSAQKLIQLIEQSSLSENPQTFGQLTEQGKREHRGIAQRMYQSFPSVFNDETRGLRLQSTHKQRTKDSLDAFLQGLTNLKSDLKERSVISAAAPPHCDPLLRFFEGCKRYGEEEDNHPLKDQFEQIWQIPAQKSAESILSRIFSGDFLKQLDKNAKILIVRNLYHFCQLQADIDWQDTSGGYCSFFANESEIGPFNWQEDAKNYFEKANGGPDRIAHQISCPLLRDFIKTSEKAMSDKEAPAANLRFAHAETIIPFLLQLGLYREDSPERMFNDPKNRTFRGSEISPMAANVQWILYRCPHDEYRIRMRHNEKDIAFPIAGCGPEGCSFQVVKDHYEKSGSTCDENTWATTMCQGITCEREG